MSSETAPSKRRATDELGDKEIRAICSMSKDGIPTDKIAMYLGLSADEVIAGCLKRRRTDFCGQDRAPRMLTDVISVEEEGVDALVKRLLTDPDELMCPILQSLMEHPVVAEDGFTYEKDAIQEALRHRRRSPKTNADMGNRVIPNQDKKLAMIEYKEKTVREIISVVPSLPSNHALQLLHRAESFVRPCLPDRTAQAKLAKLLQMRAGLPASMRGDAVQELIKILSGQPENDGVRELLTNFDAWGVASHLEHCSSLMITRFQAVARQRPRLACHEVLDKERASRLAERWQSDEGDLVDSSSAQALWQFVLELGSMSEPGIWLEGSALVLAALHGKVEVDVSTLPEELILKAVSLLKAPEYAAARASEVFKCDLGLGQDIAVCWLRSFSMLLLEETRWLREAFVADPGDASIRGRLVKLLLELLECGQLDQEDLLLKLLLLEHEKVPDELLSKLSLTETDVRTLEPASCITLAKQLQAAKRPGDGAKIAIIAAEAFSACGRREDARQSYFLAYNMDHRNADASHGVIESCVSRIDQLDIQNRHLRKELDKSQRFNGVRSFTWDISGRDFTAAQKGQPWLSPQVELPGLGGIRVWLEYYPRGHDDASPGWSSIYIYRSVPCSLHFKIFIDDEEWDDMDVLAGHPVGARKGFDNFIEEGPCQEITIVVKSVQLKHSCIKCLY